MAKGTRSALSAYAPPNAVQPKADKGKKGSTASKNATLRIMDAFGLGIYEKGSGVRKVKSTKTTARGLRRYNGPYTADEILRMARMNPNGFGETVVALSVANSMAHNSDIVLKARGSIRTSPSDPVKYTVSLMDKVLSLDPKASERFNSVAKNAGEVAKSFAAVANETQTHPLDLYKMLDVALSLSVVHAYPMHIRREVFAQSAPSGVKALEPSALMGKLSGIVKGTNDMAQFPAIVNTIKGAASKFSRSSIKSFQQVGTYLRNVQKTAEFTGFSYLRNAKPCKVPTSIPSTADEFGITNACFGFEVVDFKYAIDKDVNPDGTASSYITAKHVTSATQISQQVGSKEQFISAIMGNMSFTPAGRLFLCYSEDTKSMFFATDRAPSRQTLLVGQISERDAVVYGLKPGDPLTGFVI